MSASPRGAGIEHGSSLVELLVAVTLTGLVSVGLLSAATALASSSDRTGRRALAGAALTEVAHRVVAGSLGSYSDCADEAGLPIRLDAGLRDVPAGSAYTVEVAMVTGSVRHPDRTRWTAPAVDAVFDLPCVNGALPANAVPGIRSVQLVARTPDGRATRTLEVVRRR